MHIVPLLVFLDTNILIQISEGGRSSSCSVGGKLKKTNNNSSGEENNEDSKLTSDSLRQQPVCDLLRFVNLSW